MDRKHTPNTKLPLAPEMAERYFQWVKGNQASHPEATEVSTEDLLQIRDKLLKLKAPDPSKEAVESMIAVNGEEAFRG